MKYLTLAIMLALSGCSGPSMDQETRNVMTKFSGQNAHIIKICEVNGETVTVWEQDGEYAYLVGRSTVLAPKAFAREVSNKEEALELCKGN